MKPRLTGNIKFLDLNQSVLPFINGKPFIMRVDDCEDLFVVVFSDVNDLKSFMLHSVVMCLCRKNYNTTRYTIKQVENPHDFCNSIWDAHVRIMYDPRIVAKDHTKWHEIIRNGDGASLLDKSSEE